ncbi:hypothetical protein [Oceanicella sp. SM1341]|uniref:hypothetical protein n=1 Tax=Oceanicella sp. SM1341 TaxID=1548889 RepID=UPI000E4E237B|nr:hypothetical protein [Oceanicella sp. SM1341]
MTRLSPGEMVEIETPGGHAYAQVTHVHPSYPPVVRAIEGLHATRPADLRLLAAGPTRFVAMIPLDTALARLNVRHALLGAAPVPEAARPFPTFRMPIRDKQGEIVYWWFWDGRGLSYAVDLDAGQAGLPLREVVSGARFMDMLAA